MCCVLTGTWNSQVYAGDLVKSDGTNTTGHFKWYKSKNAMQYNAREINTNTLQICVSTVCFSAELTWSINPCRWKGAWVEFYSQGSNEMTRNWPSGLTGLILYHHPHGNCIGLLWIISELYRECMSHKSTQSFKVYSSERHQWFPRD